MERESDRGETTEHREDLWQQEGASLVGTDHIQSNVCEHTVGYYFKSLWH
jgi:hypothetical protein